MPCIQLRKNYITDLGNKTIKSLCSGHMEPESQSTYQKRVTNSNNGKLLMVSHLRAHELRAIRELGGAPKIHMVRNSQPAYFILLYSGIAFVAINIKFSEMESLIESIHF